MTTLWHALAMYLHIRRRYWPICQKWIQMHYSDAIMSTMASQITSLTMVYSTVCSGADRRKYKAPCHWPLWGEFAGDRWIPRRKGHWRGKTFSFHDVILGLNNLMQVYLIGISISTSVTDCTSSDCGIRNTIGVSHTAITWCTICNVAHVRYNNPRNAKACRWPLE